MKKVIENNGNFKNVDFYNGLFAKYYENLSKDRLSDYEKKIFIDNCRLASKKTKKVLELACGSGRVTMNLLKTDCLFTCIEQSKDMINIFKSKLNRLDNYEDNVDIIEKDVFEIYDIKEKFDLILLPATTISLLSLDNKKILKLFDDIYSLLNKEGRFIFDYGINIYNNSGYVKKIVIDGESYSVDSSVDINRKNKESILTIKLTNEKNEVFQTITKRKILSIMDIYNLIEKSKFNIVEELDEDYGKNLVVRFVILEK